MILEVTGTYLCFKVKFIKDERIITLKRHNQEYVILLYELNWISLENRLTLFLTIPDLTEHSDVENQEEDIIEPNSRIVMHS